MIKRKHKIVIAALELLEEGGVSNITTKNLAKRQGITEPALYRQFNNKHDIFIAIINEYASYDDKIMNTIIEQNLKGRAAIEFYITRFMELYQNYSELTTIVYSFDLYLYEDDAKALMTEIIKKREDFLKNWINKYPVKNCNFQPNFLATVINDLMYGEVFKWRLGNKNYSLIDSVLHNVSVLLDA